MRRERVDFYGGTYVLPRKGTMTSIMADLQHSLGICFRVNRI